MENVEQNFEVKVSLEKVRIGSLYYTIDETRGFIRPILYTSCENKTEDNNNSLPLENKVAVFDIINQIYYEVNSDAGITVVESDELRNFFKKLVIIKNKNVNERRFLPWWTPKEIERELCGLSIETINNVTYKRINFSGNFDNENESNPIINEETIKLLLKGKEMGFGLTNMEKQMQYITDKYGRVMLKNNIVSFDRKNDDIVR